ncbi:MAG: HD domain-containing phosphohydrolase, partial [Bacillota bacterium]
MENKDEYNIKISNDIQNKWQNILNLLVDISKSSNALITRKDSTFFNIIKSSNNTKNTFKEGKKVNLSKLYCNDVVENNKKLIIEDALKNQRWKNYFDYNSGYIAYLGYPLKWPSGKIFGTLSIRYKHLHKFSEDTIKIMKVFKEHIESHLSIIDKNIKIKKEYNKIEKKEKKYEKLFNKAPIGIFVTTSKGKIITINKSMAEILGFSKKEDVMKHYNDLKEDLYVNKERRDEFIKKLIENGKVKNFKYQAIGKNNKYKWISMNARKKIRNKKGSFLIEGFAFDITKEEKQNEKIKEQKSKLSNSFEKLSIYNEEIIAMNEELEQSIKEINSLNKRFINMIELISNISDKKLLNEKEFFNDLLVKAIKIIPEADYGKICLINDNDECEFVGAIGHNLETLKEIKFDKSLLLKKEEDDRNNFFDISKFEDDKNKFLKALKPIKDSIYIDILVNEQIVGRIGFDIKEDSNQEFTNTTKNVLGSFATLASSFFAFKKFDKLQANFTKELITSIIKIMEMYDLYTKGHSENVASVASAIAKAMNLSKKTIKDTYWSGLVHDIGKLLIPLNILNKKGRLTEYEFDLVKKHPIWGKKALSNSELLKPIGKNILYHHERWDGKGYPEGLNENQIPLISQILGVADAWDAMLSKRAYRDSLSIKNALKEIKNNKGTQFSPEVVESFIKIIKDNKIETLKNEVLENEIENVKNEDLLNNKDRFEDLFKESNEGIVILDDNFHIIRVNNFFLDMFGYKRNNILGMNIKMIVPKWKIKETDKFIDLLNSGKKVDSNSTREKKNGEKIKVSIQAFPVSLGTSNMGYYVIYRDITELKKTKKKYE